MGSYRSKEDDVSRTSTLIFVTNFPDSFSAKDLFHSCKQYGHGVDSFIPLKRSKEGKRFGFVRFVNEKKDVGTNRSGTNAPRKDVRITGTCKSFVHVVKSNNMSGSMESDSILAIVVDDECLYSKDLSKSLLGRVKEFATLSNLKTTLTNEGFIDIIIRYMGELWVLLEFASTKSKELFRDNVGVGSQFSVFRQASTDFNPKGRIVWVEVEGIPLKLWAGNTFKRIATKCGELLDVDDQEEMCFHSKRLCLYTKFHLNIFENFKIIFRGKVFWIRAKEVPGWVPELLEESDDDDHSDDGFKKGDPKPHDAGSCGDDNDLAEVPKTLLDESTGQKEKHSEDPFGVYPPLNKNNKEKPEIVNDDDHSLQYPSGFTPNVVMNEFVMNEENGRSVNGDSLQNCNVDEVQIGRDGDSANKGSKGSVNGSSMYFLSLNIQGLAQKAKKDWVKELCVKNKVNFLALQETKMKSMELFIVKKCWGNFAFDYVHSDSIGNSGWILCVWDPNSFCKSNTTNLDYFVMIRGVWLKTGVNLLIVTVYAPHDPRDKRMLWEYLVHVINQWNGEVVIMGDNEVRYKSDRFGLIFNAQGADAFNSFIANAGLEKVHLCGSAFTWCHKSATKMSKLDRFLISENLLITCPHISATTLERYLSDHHPILLRKTLSNYRPVPMMRKLEFLKVKIRDWINGNMNNTKGLINRYKEELQTLDAIIDKGNGSDEVANKRVDVINSMQCIDKLHAMDIDNLIISITYRSHENNKKNIR
nr:RNA-directed DNA polymerase, eukaryota, reverse transcriptase zinc-binding domain protein [Tanacetum cinerariifolium]